MNLSPRAPLAALLAGFLVSALPGAVAAHVELESSTPADGERLEQPPDEVTLTFSDELDPAGSTFTVTGANGQEVGSGGVDLDVPDRNVLSGAVSIAQPGVYRVAWTVLGHDGHEISGSFVFGYAADAGISGTAGQPDTALGAPALDGATLAGLLLIILALVGAVRRTLVR